MKMLTIEPLRHEYDAAVASLIRMNLKAHQLDIPGTAYFDEGLDHLSDFYDHPARAYYVLLDRERVVGGIGLAEFQGFSRCCELQKLYLDDSVKGQGLGYDLISFIEAQAREKKYKQIYLETHTNLQTAIHIYEKCGYKEIDRPASVVHSTMNRFYLKKLKAPMTLKQFRSRTGMTQKGLAQMMGITPLTLSRYEKGEWMLNLTITQAPYSVRRRNPRQLQINHSHDIIPYPGRRRSRFSGFTRLLSLYFDFSRLPFCV